MKKIIPFKKSLTFDTNVSEITSISLENSLGNVNNTVSGDVIINGSYKITDSSIKTDDFEFTIPIDIDIDDRYSTNDILIDIDDFYYEIINNNILEVNIDIMLDNLIEKPIIEKEEPVIEEPIIEDSVIESTSRCIEDEEKEEVNISESLEVNNTKKEINVKKVEENNSIKDEKVIEQTNIFSNFTSEKEEYSTYYVYIVREGDTIDSIMARYKISKEIIIEYNDITELKLGDKLIIPVSYA